MPENLFLNINGEKHEISQSISKEELVQILDNIYVPYIQCFKKCSRANFCKFTKNLRHRKADQKCGFMKTIISNYFDVSLKNFAEWSLKKKQIFFDTSIKLFDSVWYLETYIGSLLNKDVLDWYSDYSWLVIGVILKERKRMENIANQFSKINLFKTDIKVLLVEGKGDKSFFEAIHDELRWRLPIISNINTLEGKSNIRKNRIDLLLRDMLKTRAEKTVLILDGDGSKEKTDNSLKKLWQQNLIRKKDIFVFKYNLEFAFPDEYLIEALVSILKEMKSNVKINENEIKKVIRKRGDFLNNLELIYGIKIKKVKFDIKLGQLLRDVLAVDFNKIIEDKQPYQKDEIFKLIRFLDKISTS